MGMSKRLSFISLDLTKDEIPDHGVDYVTDICFTTSLSISFTG